MRCVSERRIDPDYSQLDVLQDIYLEFEYYHPNCLADALNLIFEHNDPSQITPCLANLLQMLLIDSHATSDRCASYEELLVALTLLCHPLLLAGQFSRQSGR